jgi:hypothetical protein
LKSEKILLNVSYLNQKDCKNYVYEVAIPIFGVVNTVLSLKKVPYFKDIMVWYTVFKAHYASEMLYIFFSILLQFPRKSCFRLPFKLSFCCYLFSFCNRYNYSDLIFCMEVKIQLCFNFPTFMAHTCNSTSSASFLGY